MKDYVLGKGEEFEPHKNTLLLAASRKRVNTIAQTVTVPIREHAVPRVELNSSKPQWKSGVNNGSAD